MSAKRKIHLLAYLLLYMLVIGCRKNGTRYYPDKETPGLSIFSNTGNNVLSCAVNGQAWQTVTRATSGLIGRTSYELYVTRHRTGSLLDTLSFSWRGSYTSNQLIQGDDITLFLPIAKNFRLSDLQAWQGRRLVIDSSNGYFSANIAGTPSVNAKGRGVIYFNTIRFDSSAQQGITGKISGTMEAGLNAVKISTGRFDHAILPDQVRNY
ncbi:MAG: hypothetical protein ABIQ88_22645 [Chitinophagaceae bacterium]